ncbi:hypothetical protein [Paenibacillus sp. FSL L8-0499]
MVVSIIGNIKINSVGPSSTVLVVFLLNHNAAKLVGLPVRKLPDIMTVF